jgi:hypothetical protein
MVLKLPGRRAIGGGRSALRRRVQLLKELIRYSLCLLPASREYTPARRVDQLMEPEIETNQLRIRIAESGLDRYADRRGSGSIRFQSFRLLFESREHQVQPAT